VPIRRPRPVTVADYWGGGGDELQRFPDFYAPLSVGRACSTFRLLMQLRRSGLPAQDAVVHGCVGQG